MRLHPRHYVLFAVIVAIFVYNMVRHRRDQQNTVSTTTVPAPIVAINSPRLNTPAWAAFDHAASLRDATADEFEPALKDLNQLLPLDPNQADGHLTDIKGCITWLEFYRQGMAQTRTDPQMKARSVHHVDNCVKYHLDTSA
jgi:hypothetical protein